MSGNQRIHHAYGFPRLVQRRTHCASLVSGRRREIDHRHNLGKGLNCSLQSPRFAHARTVEKFMVCYRAHAQSSCMGNDPTVERLVRSANHVTRNVGIEHVPACHANSSLRWPLCASLLSSSKSGHAYSAKNRFHVIGVRGVNTSELPLRTIVTSGVEILNAAGIRTAWDRPDMNTFATFLTTAHLPFLIKDMTVVYIISHAKSIDPRSASGLDGRTLVTFPQEQRRTAAVDAGRGAGGSEACAPGPEGGVREAPEGLGQGAGAAVAAGQGGVAEGRSVAQPRLGGG